MKKKMRKKKSSSKKVLLVRIDIIWKQKQDCKKKTGKLLKVFKCLFKIKLNQKVTLLTLNGNNWTIYTYLLYKKKGLFIPFYCH